MEECVLKVGMMYYYHIYSAINKSAKYKRKVLFEVSRVQSETTMKYTYVRVKRFSESSLRKHFYVEEQVLKKLALNFFLWLF